MKYFAYGSNMCFRRFHQRVPSGIFETIATIRGFDLRFHVKDDDGSGKCNAIYTGNDEDFVMGVVYDIEATEKHLLDKAEDLGIEYKERETIAETKDGTVEVFLYTAISDVINDQTIPFDWYKNFVVYGAREHGLPADYIRMLEGIPVKYDPDVKRAEKNRSVLFG